MSAEQLIADALRLADQGGPPPRWHQQAACLGAPTPVFFPPPRRGNATQAAQMCNTCPVRTACLADGIQAERNGLQSGIRAGIGRQRISRIARGGIRNLSRTTAQQSGRAAALTDAGHTAAQIAQQLGVSPRTVQRWRQHATQPGKAA